MSDFPGPVVEIPGLSIDRFDGNNFKSTIYLLSHCHFDHLIGIDDPHFLENLFTRPEVFIYMSEVSAKILKTFKPHLSEKIKSLPINCTSLLNILSQKIENSNTLISITLIPAGHCPGSVMFLIEADKVLLYTGDFRIKPCDLKKLKCFYMFGDTTNQVKKIDKIYLDTTFFHIDYPSFPSRDEVIQNLHILIQEWLEKDENNLIFLHTSAHIGYEDLFIELYTRLNIPIHVNQNAYEFYKHFPEMDKAVTLNENSRIHACRDGNPNLIKKMCKTYYDTEKNVRTIKLSAFRWTEKCLTKTGVYFSKERENFFFICYSTHASYEEIREFMLFLKPDEIEPCVYLPDSDKNQMMLTLINELVDSYKNKTNRENIKLLPENIFSSKKALKRSKENLQCNILSLLENKLPKKFK